MRVLQCIPSLCLAEGGPARAIVVLEQALTARGVEVVTLTTDDDGPGRRLPPACQGGATVGVRRVYCRKWSDFYKVAPGAVSWILRNVNRYDVIHIHGLFSFVSIAVALVARLAGRPYIVRPLGSLSAYGVATRRPLLKRFSLALLEGPILKHAAAVHCTSEQELNEARALGLSFSGVVVPLGVEPAAPGCAALIDLERHDAAGRKTVLFLSRIDRKKNLECVLHAVRLLVDRELDLTCLIAGDGDPRYVAELKALGCSLHLRDRVVWLGHVEGERKAAALAAADVFVLASYSENFGIAAVEALLAGLPCVLSKGVAIADDVAAEGACIAVEPEAREVADALATLLESEKRRAAMARRAALVGATRYSVHAMAERLMDLYRKVSHASA